MSSTASIGPKPIVSVAGLRGIVGESFTPEVIVPYVAAFADMIEDKRVVVGGDSRPSRAWAQPAVEATLRARGIDVISIGLAPTPTVGMAVRHFQCGGGICITASHNPIAWNGLKFFNEGGEFLTPAQHERLHHLLLHPAQVPQRIGSSDWRAEEIFAAHRDAIFRQLPPLAPGQRRLKIVLDCCDGAGSLFIPEIAGHYATEVETFFDEPERMLNDWRSDFPRIAEPLPENLTKLAERVRATGADLGAAIDPDADRLALVDETGRPIGEERTLILGAAAYKAATGDKSPLVANLSTSMALDRVAESCDVPLYRTKIGEAHVMAGMRQHSAAIGGEGNGGVILPAIHPGRDAATAVALILTGLTKRGGTLSQWNASFPDYAMIKDKVELGTISVADSLRRAREAFAGATVDDTDGVKFSWPDRWIHMRPSGTEPLLRLFAEAPTEADALALIRRGKDVVR